MKMKAPEVDLFLAYSQQNPLVEDKDCEEKLMAIFDLMCEIQEQGDDEMRSIWIEADRGSIDDFGSFEEYQEENIVETDEEFKEYWLSYYPDRKKWYSFSVTRFQGIAYFYFDFKLIFKLFSDEKTYRESSRDIEFINWLYFQVDSAVARLKVSSEEYNIYIAQNLPYQKRLGRILRKDLWEIFQEEKMAFASNLPKETIDILEKVVIQSTGDLTSLELEKLTAGDFFRYCQIGYDANNCFKNNNGRLSAKEKYLKMADGRDCGLTQVDEESAIAFNNWYDHESRCGGHPWEIFRGGNSTHISLFVERKQTGWLLRLAGSSSIRVIETVKMAKALYQAKVPFYLQQSKEILRMVTGQDYIGIVPETIIPQYCSRHFPAEDQIIDFMNLGMENKNEIIQKTFWYPEPTVKLK